MSDPEGPWHQPPPPPEPTRRRRLGPWLWLGLLLGTGGAFLLAATLLPADCGDMDWTEALRLFGVLAVVSSGLVSARQFDFPRAAKMAAGWVVIFLVVATAYVLRDDIAGLGRRVGMALVPAHAVADGPRGLVIGRSDDGAFYVIGEVNGEAVRFVVDTGSTDIVLSPTDAERVGLHPAADAFTLPNETANGVGYGAAATAHSLGVGPIRMTDVPVQINRAPMGASLLGMSFLRRLESFEVRGDRLYLRGRS